MKADTRKTRRDGDCYKASAEGLLRMAEQLGNELRLAHGTCTLTAGHLKGKASGHAWLETEDLVFDLANNRDCVHRRDVYYKVGKCRKVVRYTLAQTREMLLKHRTYGPWHKTKALHA